MAETRLSVRSAKPRDIAHRLALREGRSITEIVERALEAYEAGKAGREPASSFYARLTAECSSDVELDAAIGQNHRAHLGPEL